MPSEIHPFYSSLDYWTSLKEPVCSSMRKRQGCLFFSIKISDCWISSALGICPLQQMLVLRYWLGKSWGFVKEGWRPVERIFKCKILLTQIEFSLPLIWWNGHWRNQWSYMNAGVTLQNFFLLEVKKLGKHLAEKSGHRFRTPLKTSALLLIA